MTALLCWRLSEADEAEAEAEEAEAAGQLTREHRPWPVMTVRSVTSVNSYY